jgi:hypothetical protein
MNKNRKRAPWRGAPYTQKKTESLQENQPKMEVNQL